MLSFEELNKVWAANLKNYGGMLLPGARGPYKAIGGRSLDALKKIWQKRTDSLPDLGTMISSGKTIRFFSDPHFEHANIIHMCERPFHTVEEMDETMMQNIIRAFTTSDMVVCVGDLSLKNPLGIQRRFFADYPGRYINIVGNHDLKAGKPEQWAISGAASSLAFTLAIDIVKNWIQEDHPDEFSIISWKDAPKYINFGMSHWPIPPQYMPGRNWISIHGHIHNRPSNPLRLNCSMEAIGYQPKTLRDLLLPEHIDQMIEVIHNPAAFDDTDDQHKQGGDYL